MISHLQLCNCSLKISNINLGRASQARQEVFAPLGQSQQSLIKLLQLLQLRLQQLKSEGEVEDSVDEEYEITVSIQTQQTTLEEEEADKKNAWIH